jgi:hypothetical protein
MMRGIKWGAKKNIDQEKVKQNERNKQRIAELLETGDEEGYVELIKKLDPSVTPERLLSLIECFREERFQRSWNGGARPS